VGGQSLVLLQGTLCAMDSGSDEVSDIVAGSVQRGLMWACVRWRGGDDSADAERNNNYMYQHKKEIILSCGVDEYASLLGGIIDGNLGCDAHG
jgi:hypothetical protein